MTPRLPTPHDRRPHAGRWLAAALLLGVTHALAADTAAPKTAITYKTEENLFYYEGEAAAKAGDYQRAQCRLDLYYPANSPGFATVIWLHGGGFTGGHRSFPLLKDKGLGIVTIDYRLSPKASFPAFLQDAAAATAWTFRHIAERGGDPQKIFLSGHSAGGYLAAMVGMDPRWLAAFGLSNRQLAAVIPVSAQVTTHFTVKKLLGDTGPELRPLIDQYAPLYYASKDLPPICLITGDRRIEYKNRVEENDLLATALRNLGAPSVEFHEMGGLDHGLSRYGAWIIIPHYIKKVLRLAPHPPATPAH